MTRDRWTGACIALGALAGLLLFWATWPLIAPDTPASRPPRVTPSPHPAPPVWTPQPR